MRYGVIFWATKEKGIIVDLINYKQFECNEGVIRFLENKTEEISESDFKFLETNGIIDYFDQEKFFEKIINIKRAMPFKGKIYIESTRKCNLHCLGCYNSSGMQNTGELSSDKANEIADVLAKLGNPEVIITGGEPLILKDWVNVISAFSQRFKTEIFSNGTLITEAVASELKRINVYEVRISIDGANAETHDYLRGVRGAFNRSIAGIKNLKKVGIHVTMQATISKYNINQVKDMIDLAETLGVDFRASPMVDLGRAHENQIALSIPDEIRLKEILDSYTGKGKINISWGESFCDVSEEWRNALLKCDKLTEIEKKYVPFVRSSVCDVGLDRFLFNYKGELQLCPLLSGEKFTIEHDLSKVTKETLYKNTLSKSLQAPLSTRENCKSCGIRYLCKGSCRGKAAEYYGDLNACNVGGKEYFKMIIEGGAFNHAL